MTCPQGSENMNSYSEVIFIINQKLSDWRHFETQYWQNNEENGSFEPKWVSISPEIVFGEDDIASQFILYLLSSTSSEHHHEIENRYGIQSCGQLRKGRNSLFIRLLNNDNFTCDIKWLSIKFAEYIVLKSILVRKRYTYW